jgi:hypothetical protein
VGRGILTSLGPRCFDRSEDIGRGVEYAAVDLLDQVGEVEGLGDGRAVRLVFHRELVANPLDGALGVFHGDSSASPALCDLKSERPGAQIFQLRGCN